MNPRDGEIAMSLAKPFTTLLVVSLQDGVPHVLVSKEILTGSLDIKNQALSLIRLLCNLDENNEAYLIKLVEDQDSSPNILVIGLKS